MYDTLHQWSVSQHVVLILFFSFFSRFGFASFHRKNAIVDNIFFLISSTHQIFGLSELFLFQILGVHIFSSGEVCLIWSCAECQLVADKDMFKYFHNKQNLNIWAIVPDAYWCVIIYIEPKDIEQRSHRKKQTRRTCSFVPRTDSPLLRSRIHSLRGMSQKERKRNKKRHESKNGEREQHGYYS